MAIPVSTECLTKAEDGLREILSRCSTVQTWLGTPGNQANTLARIEVDALTDPVNREAYENETAATDEWEDLHPSCLVETSPENGYTIVHAAQDMHYLQSGNLRVYFAKLLTAEEYAAKRDTLRNIKNIQGAIAREMTEQDPTYIKILAIGAILPTLMELADDDPYGKRMIEFGFAVNWGQY